MSPTTRTLEKLRADGWTCAVVEKFNHHVQVRQDLFGFADVLAYKDDTALLVQTTSDEGGSHSGARIRKIFENPHVVTWLQSPYRRLQVHGWCKRGPRNKRKLWVCREREIVLQGDQLHVASDESTVPDLARPQKTTNGLDADVGGRPPFLPINETSPETQATRSI